MGCLPLVGRDVYVTQPMPSFTMGPISVSPQFTHPTHNASNMHNSMSVMHKPHTSYVALPIQAPSGQALSLHGYGYVEGTSNYNTLASDIQASNGQVITSIGYGRVEGTLINNEHYNGTEFQHSQSSNNHGYAWNREEDNIR
ncbi:hypothetical protein Acr_00g0038430 [Actinidia rufa]|uniref:Uncharacterized protein n=1 Tax=Actinidia rufa TaxID=165716 RepID=A0A7J0DJ30_9ERIC|nr:hypothetical protein Acr_00g0038430 [Actinidia rufa]